MESEKQLRQTAENISKSGASLLRGGLFKMRTDPQSFQGLGERGFEIFKKVSREFGLPIVSEVSDQRHIELMEPLVDMFQVGTRNMYNYALLKELGRTNKPVLLKRGFTALIDEWLLASEYIASAGNERIILCERGIRTFERATRNTLDLSAVAYLKARTHFPVLVDPSHGTGISDLIKPMSLAAAAAGADGLLIEVHPEPARALSDADQALNPSQFDDLMVDLERVLVALGRPLRRPIPQTTTPSNVVVLSHESKSLSH